MNEDIRLAGTALCCWAAMLALGFYVAQRSLTPLDLKLTSLRGRGTRPAVMFTWSGYWPALTGVAVVVAAIDLVLRGNIEFALALAATQLLSQGAATITKETFKRIRPDDWLFRQERGASFPSGHATTAIVFFGGLMVFVWGQAGPRPLQAAASAVLAVWIAGIPWSRMVLGAHYASDVLGGLLFGAFWLCLLVLLLRHVPGAHISA